MRKLHQSWIAKAIASVVLAIVLIRFGARLRDRHAVAESLALHEKMLSVMKSKFGPDHPDTLECMCRVADCLFRLDRGAEAIPVLDDYLARASGPYVHPRLIPGIMEMRWMHFHGCGDWVGCRATAEMWERLNRTDGESCYIAARMRAALAASGSDRPGTSDADMALEWLNRAVAADFGNLERLKQDPQFDTLRDHAGLRALHAQKAAPN